MDEARQTVDPVPLSCLSFPKILSEGIGTMGKNQRIIRHDRNHRSQKEVLDFNRCPQLP
jgi:hypothetical protein